MNTTKALKKYTEMEMNNPNQNGTTWHDEFDKCSYIFIANLNYGMNEGDIAIVFSQFGEIVDVHLVRDKITGKSKGFCFLAYEDQRSTVLAVDNFNHSEVCGRLLRVDHVREFKPPKEYYEIQPDDPAIFDKLYKPSGPDGRGWGEFREKTAEELELIKQIEAQQNEISQRNERILGNLEQIKDVQGIIDDDERWDKLLMIEDEKQELIDKIAALQQFNTKMSKPKKQVESKAETNEERARRMNQQKDIQKEKKDKKSKKQKKQKKEKKEKKQNRRNSEN